MNQQPLFGQFGFYQEEQGGRVRAIAMCKRVCGRMTVMDIHEGRDGNSLSQYVLVAIMGYLNDKNTFIISHLLSLCHFFFSIAAKVKREGVGLNMIGKVSIKLSLDI